MLVSMSTSDDDHSEGSWCCVDTSAHRSSRVPFVFNLSSGCRVCWSATDLSLRVICFFRVGQPREISVGASSTVFAVVACELLNYHWRSLFTFFITSYRRNSFHIVIIILTPQPVLYSKRVSVGLTANGVLEWSFLILLLSISNDL